MSAFKTPDLLVVNTVVYTCTYFCCMQKPQTLSVSFGYVDNEIKLSCFSFLSLFHCMYIVQRTLYVQSEALLKFMQDSRKLLKLHDKRDNAPGQ